jgi:very-short-patch-repair endonuclease
MNPINVLLQLFGSIPHLSLFTIGCVVLVLISIPTPRRAWRFTRRRFGQRYHQRQYFPHRESPAEMAFWQAWMAQHNHLILEKEYGVGPYRIDFVHLPTKTAIEIDGMLGHSSPDDISKDRSRQRFLEERGWRFIRFGAKEVFRNPSQCARETEQFLRRASFKERGRAQ